MSQARSKSVMLSLGLLVALGLLIAAVLLSRRSSESSRLERLRSDSLVTSPPTGLTRQSVTSDRGNSFIGSSADVSLSATFRTTLSTRRTATVLAQAAIGGGWMLFYPNACGTDGSISYSGVKRFENWTAHVQIDVTPDRGAAYQARVQLEAPRSGGSASSSSLLNEPTAAACFFVAQ